MSRTLVAPAALVALTLTAVIGAGCSDDAGDYNRVSGLRLLDVRSEPAEAAPGDSVRLIALAVDANGSPIYIAWLACTKPPYAGSTVNPDCLDKDLRQSWFVSLGAGADVTRPLPSVPSEVFGAADATGGVYLPIRAILENGSESLDGMYRLRYALPGTGDPTALNHNPVLAGVFAGTTEITDAAPLVAHADDKIALSGRFDSGSAETYAVALADGTRRANTEQLSISWFSTAGRFGIGSTGDAVETTLDLSQSAPSAGAIVDLWVVGRDERGGSDWLHRTIRIQ